MSMRYILLGGTDLTLALAEHMASVGFPPSGIVTLGQNFSISYNRNAVNVRFANIGGWSAKAGIPCREYDDPKDIAALGSEVGADFALAAGWYFLVPKSIRDSFPLGCLGLHASLLPKLRGAAPLNWAILSGEHETGVTLFRLENGVDEGPVLGQEVLPISDGMTVTELAASAEKACLRLAETMLPSYAAGRLALRDQTGDATYCLARIPEDGWIDWTWDAPSIARLVRAVTRPYSGTFTELGGEHLTIWRARALQTPRVLGVPGQVAVLPVVPVPSIVTGGGLLAIEEATLPSGADAVELLRRCNNRRLTVSRPTTLREPWPPTWPAYAGRG